MPYAGGVEPYAGGGDPYPGGVDADVEGFGSADD
jgi:hypothetical protein